MHRTSYSLQVVTPASGNIVTRAEAKLWARVDIIDDDALIDALIDSAEKYAQAATFRQFLNAEFDLHIDRWENPIIIPKVGVTTVGSIKYRDQDDVLQTLSTSVYDVDVTGLKAIIYLKENQEWPDTITDRPRPITINFNAGESSVGDVPEQAKTFVKMYVADMYEHRMLNSEDKTELNKATLMQLNSIRIPATI